MRLVLLLAATSALYATAGWEPLLDQLEETSRAQRPLDHIDTLLSAADLLPESDRRLELLESAVTLLAVVPEDEPRYLYLAGAANLLARQDWVEAERICLRLPARQSARWRADYRGRCWQFLATQSRDRRATVLKGLQTGAFHIPMAVELIAARPEDGAEILQALMTSYPGKRAAWADADLLDRAARLVAPFNLGLAHEAALLLRHGPARPPKPEPPPDAPDPLTPYQLVDQLGLPPGERLNRMVRVLDSTPGMKDYPWRLQVQALLAARFSAEGAAGLAVKAADMLDASLAACAGESCLDALDNLAEFIRGNGLALQPRHAGLRARLLLRDLRVLIRKDG